MNEEVGVVNPPSKYKEYTISPSGLNAFRISPAAFIRYKEKLDKSEGKHFEIGTAFHCYLLQPELFNDNYVVSDTPPMEGMMGDFIRSFFELFSDAENNNFENWRKEVAYKLAYATSGFKTKIETVIKQFENEDDEEKHRKNMNYFNLLRDNKGKIILTSKDLELFLEMRTKVFDHKVASRLFMDDGDRDCEYLNEFEYNWTNGKFNMHGILDRVVIDHEAKTAVLIDLKTARYSDKKSFLNSYEKYRYYAQITFYRQGVLAYLEEKGLTDYKIFSYIVVCQKGYGSDCSVFSLADSDIIRGAQEIIQDLSDISYHFDNDNWEYSKEYYEGNGIIELDLNEKERL
jgi:hypothetical protein